MERRRATEGDVVARGVGDGADIFAGGRGLATNVGAHARDVVVTEGLLDLLQVRQRPTPAADATSGRVLHISRATGPGSLRLNGRQMGGPLRVAHAAKLATQAGPSWFLALVGRVSGLERLLGTDRFA